MGNFVPALFWLPFAVYGVYEIFVTRQILGIGLVYLGIATVTGWIGLNLFGFFQNGAMRRQLSKVLCADSDLPPDRVFVGFSSPRYTGLLDAHEDVGFLCFTPKALLFVGEHRTIEMPRETVRGVGFRPNVHTIVALGRWISVEGDAAGRTVRMLLESRERSTMMGNFLEGPALRRKIDAWIKDASPSAKAVPQADRPVAARKKK
jgi:hypothetical protein